MEDLNLYLKDVITERKGEQLDLFDGEYTMTIKCPKCGKETAFEPERDAIDDEGEIYRCQHCGWPFHYK